MYKEILENHCCLYYIQHTKSLYKNRGCQRQLRVIICAHCVVLQCLMFTTSRSLKFGSGKDFLKVIYGPRGHLGEFTWSMLTHFSSCLPWILLVKFCFDCPNGSVMQTCLCNVDTLTPHFYIVGNGVYRGIRYFLI